MPCSHLQPCPTSPSHRAMSSALELPGGSGSSGSHGTALKCFISSWRGIDREVRYGMGKPTSCMPRCSALHGAAHCPPQLGDLGLGQPRCLTSPWDHSWMQHRIAGSEGWGYGTAPHRPWYHTDPGTRLTPAPSTPPNRPGRSGVQTVPREQGGREMDTTASSLWLSPPGPSTTLCHTAGLQQDGDRVLHASACGQGNGAEGGGADVAGLARGAESRYLRALLPAAERRTQEQRSTHPIQRQRSPSCPRRASRCPSTAPSLEPR